MLAGIAFYGSSSFSSDAAAIFPNKVNESVFSQCVEIVARAVRGGCTRFQEASMKKFIIVGICLFFASAGWAQTSLPTGTALKMKLETTLATFSSHVGDTFQARVTEPVVLDGKTVVPIGTTVQGRITKVTEPRRVAGKPTIALFPEALVMPNGDRVLLNATLVDTNVRRGTDVNNEGQFKGAGHDGKDSTEIGMGAGGGMLIGGLAGGGQGVLIGGAIGAGVTVTHWLAKHRSATLPAGTELVMELDRPMLMSPNGQ
jgi:hypothetical protein